MKKVICLLSMFVFSLIYAQPKYDINVIAVGIGEKNPTFNESLFPHIAFYYTPKLVSQAQLNETGKSALSFVGKAAREVFEGEPKVIAQWWDERDLRKHAIVFDKNGVGTWQGYLEVGGELIDSKGKGEESSLEDTFEFLLEDNEIMDYDKDKEFDPDDFDCLIERKMVDFEVAANDGKTKSIKSCVEIGKPTMVVFFQIPKDVDINAMKTEKKDESVGGFLSSMTQQAAGENWMTMFKDIESQFFNKK
ncbi:MAG: hypothetical protein WCS69_04910 [Ignavibacteriaceae bacterium]|jgi:hypothetical protein